MKKAFREFFVLFPSTHFCRMLNLSFHKSSAPQGVSNKNKLFSKIYGEAFWSPYEFASLSRLNPSIYLHTGLPHLYVFVFKTTTIQHSNSLSFYFANHLVAFHFNSLLGMKFQLGVIETWSFINEIFWWKGFENVHNILTCMLRKLWRRRKTGMEML